ncbi:hypothetical protein [Kitasatospora sp. NPDC093558]|uniref:hypothetical protein n=1 Tax=Kitasatospora sp. NPDC093558 TaxID=3155201 RepID=UPI00341F6373
MAEASAAGAQRPWLAEEGLAWQPDHRLMVLCSAAHSTVDCSVAAGLPQPAETVRVPAPRPGFEDLGGLDILLRELLARVDAFPDEAAVSRLRSRHQDTLDLLTSPAQRQEIGRVLPFSEAAALGTTRRISRESHTSALWIDAAARLVADCARLLAGTGPLLLDVAALDLWDRPSVRVLYRAALVAADGSAGLLVRGFLGRPSAAQDEVVGRLRGTFFDNLAARRGVIVHLPEADGETRGTAISENGAEALESAVHRALQGGLPDLLRLVGDSLAMQNFERSRLVSGTARRLHENGGISAGDGPELQVQLFRLEAISAAQVGDIPEAELLLGKALELARRPEDVAHLNYLLALIATKRSYDPEAARTFYGRARRAVDDLADPSVEALVERAWVGNGLALAAVLEARKATDPVEREARFAEAYREELAAFAAVRGLPGMSAFYLRYNLGYNLSFLLEITGRYEQAQSFLTSVSSVLLSADRSDYLALYQYAIGLLRLRNQDFPGSAESLELAVGLAESLRDPFYLERMLSALGYVEHKRGRHAEALAVFREGTRLARWLRDEDAYRQQLSGLLWSAVLGTEPLDAETLAAAEIHFPAAVRDLASGDQERSIAALHAAGAEILVPSSKLPSYVASVDLEGRPSYDLNRFLAGVATTERPETEGAIR